MEHKIDLFYNGCSIHGCGNNLQEAADDLMFNIINFCLSELKNFERNNSLAIAILIAAEKNLTLKQREER